MDQLSFYRTIYLIRRFEETVLEEFARGVFSGTTHTSLGQEANAAGVISQIDLSKDLVFSNHRCHGHFLAYGGDPRTLFAEMMGKATGVCAGRGGSQHLHWRKFYSNGILGGMPPIAVGAALAEKYRRSGALSVSFIGDGMLGEGTVYEAFNLASLWEIPVLFVVENNHIAQTTPTGLALAGSIAARFQAFAIPSLELDTSDVEEIAAAAAEQVCAVRAQQVPRALILNTERFGPHSKGDDTRPAELIAQIKATRDPLSILGARLDPAETAPVRAEVDRLVRAAFEQALADPILKDEG